MMTPGYGTLTVDASSPSIVVEPMAYSVENPQYPLTDPSLWTAGSISEAGTRVNHETAIHVPAVYQAVTRIAGDIARCPFELVEEVDDIRRALLSHPLNYVTSIKANREMSAFKFWFRIMVYRLLWQNAYFLITKNGVGGVAELVPLLPDRTTPHRDRGFLYYVTEVDGQLEPIPAERIVHLEGIGFDNLQGYDLVSAARDAWGLSLAQINFASKFFKRGGRVGGVLEIPAAFTKPAADKLEEGFRKRYDDIDSAFLTVILRENAKFHTAQATMRDSQMTEGRRESTRDAARFFNIRPGHLGEESAVSYGSKYEDTRDYVDMTLAPHMAGIAAECRIKLLPERDQVKRYFRHNTDELLQMSPKERAEMHVQLVNGMIETSNEARKDFELAPLDGGNDLRNPNTTSGGTSGQDNGDASVGGRVAAAHRKLLADKAVSLAANIGRKAKSVSATSGNFIEWLDSAFAAERSTIARVIEPIAACIAAATGGDPGSITEYHAGRIWQSLFDGMQKIQFAGGDDKLLPAVDSFFEKWSYAP